MGGPVVRYTRHSMLRRLPTILFALLFAGAPVATELCNAACAANEEGHGDQRPREVSARPRLVSRILEDVAEEDRPPAGVTVGAGVDVGHVTLEHGGEVLLHAAPSKHFCC